MSNTVSIVCESCGSYERVLVELWNGTVGPCPKCGSRHRKIVSDPLELPGLFRTWKFPAAVFGIATFVGALALWLGGCIR